MNRVGIKPEECGQSGDTSYYCSLSGSSTKKINLRKGLEYEVQEMSSLLQAVKNPGGFASGRSRLSE
jgi:hypothetical protein